jgi:filamentous hemagglutinin family protein
VVLRLAACGWVALLAALVPRAAAAQHITIDGTIHRPLTLTGPHYLIGAGLGREVGGNLFESFGVFGLAAGESAAFTGPAGVVNIIGRMTGGYPSTINGAVQSDIAGANLYLINPEGVVFGPRATVNVTGSFYASTADYLALGHNGRFRATHPDGSRLTAAPPSAFGFLAAKPAAITVNGSQLGSVPGTLGLVGGPISVRGGAGVQAGAIDVTAVAGKGVVPVNPRRKAATTVARFGRVAIKGGSTFDAVNAAAGKAGGLAVTAGRLRLSGGAQLLSTGEDSGHGDPIRVSARSILIQKGAEIASNALGTGNGGSVQITAGNLRILAGGAIVSRTIADGNGGNVRVTARSLRVAGSGAINSFTGGAGRGGEVSVDAGTLSVTRAGEILTVALAGSHGGAGAVVVAAGRLEVVDGSIGSDAAPVSGGTPASAGNAGDVTVRARSLRVAEAGAIASETHGAGNGGAVSVDVTGEGTGALTIRTNGQITAATSGAGDGGRIEVEVAGGLTIDGAAAKPNLQTGIVGATAGPGTGGSVRVAAHRLRILGGGAIGSNPSGSGNAGDVTVTARSARLAGFGLIGSETFGAGNGGGVAVDVTGRGRGALTIRTNGEIAGFTFGAGNGGRIAVDVAGGLTIDGAGANPRFSTGIDASAEPGSNGNAGDLAVAARRLRLADFATISSNTSGAGHGGKVSVDVTGEGCGALTIRTNGMIDAGAFAAGDGGRIAVDVAGGLTIDAAGSDRRLVTGIAASTNPHSTGNAGSVTVRAGQITIVGFGGAISVATFGPGAGGEISVTAGRLRLAQFAMIDSETIGSARPGGKVSVDVTGEGAGALTIQSNGEIIANTFGAGNGGRIAVDVAGGLTIDGAGANPRDVTGITASAAAGSQGNAGDLSVRAGSLTLVDGGVIESAALGARNSQPASTGNGGRVTVTVSGALSIEGPGSEIATTADVGTIGNAGSVTVGAGQITLEARGEIAAATFGAGNGGRIEVDVVGALKIDGTGVNPGSSTGINASAEPGSTGNAGDMSVSSGSLMLLNGGVILSAAIGAFDHQPASTGNAGKVAVTVTGALSIDGPGSEIGTTTDPGTIGSAGSVMVRAGAVTLGEFGAIASTSFGAGNGGNVAVDVAGAGAGALTIRTDGVIAASTFGAGTGGRIAVAVAGRLIIDGAGANPHDVTGITASADAGSTGNAGDLSVYAGSLTLVDGGAIESAAIGARHSRPASTGNAGKITVTVAGLLSIEGPGSEIGTTTDAGTIGNAGSVTVSAGGIMVGTGGGILSTTAGTGAGGSVDVTASAVLLLDGAGTEIAASATGRRSGPGGNVTVAADNLIVEGGAEIASTTAGTGTGGNVAVSAGSEIVLSGAGPQITARSTGRGNAGPVAVSASRLLMNNGAAISTQAKAASGGDISLSVGDLLFLANSEITTSVQGPTSASNGGNINIGADLAVLDHGNIIADAIGGNGGNIDIVTGAFIASPDSLVQATSQKGISGIVSITGITPLNGALVALSSELRSAVALTADSCAARAGRLQSSLVEAGRGGLPQDPNATLPALYIASRDVAIGQRVVAHRAEVGGDPRAAPRAALRCG